MWSCISKISLIIIILNAVSIGLKSLWHQGVREELEVKTSLVQINAERSRRMRKQFRRKPSE